MHQDLLQLAKVWASKDFILMVPMMVWLGLEIGWIYGSFTANVVKPSLGQANIGWIMAAYGAFDAFFSFALGRISDKIGKIYANRIKIRT